MVTKKPTFLNHAKPLVCAIFGEKTPEEIAQINKRKSELAVRRAQVLTAENKIKQAIEILETTLNFPLVVNVYLALLPALTDVSAELDDFESSNVFLLLLKKLDA